MTIQEYLRFIAHEINDPDISKKEIIRLLNRVRTMCQDIITKIEGS